MKGIVPDRARPWLAQHPRQQGTRCRAPPAGVRTTQRRRTALRWPPARSGPASSPAKLRLDLGPSGLPVLTTVGVGVDATSSSVYLSDPRGLSARIFRPVEARDQFEGDLGSLFLRQVQGLVENLLRAPAHRRNFNSRHRSGRPEFLCPPRAPTLHRRAERRGTARERTGATCPNDFVGLVGKSTSSLVSVQTLHMGSTPGASTLNDVGCGRAR